MTKREAIEPAWAEVCQLKIPGTMTTTMMQGVLDDLLRYFDKIKLNKREVDDLFFKIREQCQYIPSTDTVLKLFKEVQTYRTHSERRLTPEEIEKLPEGERPLERG